MAEFVPSCSCTFLAGLLLARLLTTPAFLLLLAGVVTVIVRRLLLDGPKALPIDDRRLSSMQSSRSPHPRHSLGDVCGDSDEDEVALVPRPSASMPNSTKLPRPRSSAPSPDRLAELQQPPLPVAPKRMLSFLVSREEEEEERVECASHHGRSLRLQVASDLHIEMLCDDPRLSEDDVEALLHEMIVPSAPYLVLAGDIGCPGTERGEKFLRDFLLRQSQQFEVVMFVAGNHEYYSGVSALTGTYLTAPEVHAIIKNMCASLPNVVFLDRKAALIEGVRIVGATLWTHIDSSEAHDVMRVVSDYRRVHLPVDPKKAFVSARTLTTADVNAWHYYDKVFLEEQMQLAETNGERVVVITHHSPSFDGTSHPCHAKSAIQSAFSVDLEHMMRDPVKAWIFGHTHYCVDKHIAGVRLVSNQKGYYFDSEAAYRNDFVVSV